jgi:histidine triad (HIT) family protein
MSDESCLFCRIVRGEIPCRKVYEDDDLLAFHDIHPQAPVHFMIIPKRHVDSLAATGPEHERVLGRMFGIAGRLAREQGLADGFRTIVNTGRIGRQDVYHLHIHILGGPEPFGRMMPP